MNFSFPNLTHLEPEPPRQFPGGLKFIVRKADQRDLATLAEILADSFHPRTGMMRWAYPLLRLGIYEDLRMRLRSGTPHTACLVAVAQANTPNGTYEYLAGTIEMGLKSSYHKLNRESQYPYISNLAVRRSFRRQGVAQKLLAACERTACDWGFQDIYLHVLENNHHARQLYFKTGYRSQKIDSSWSSYLLRLPRRIFLHKHLAATSAP